MPLWDSVQRSLEKASQEAARIARTQRLRSIIEGLTRQINTQNNAIVNKAMELFVSGQLAQSELVPICQEMLNLHQQLNQAQNELKQLQIQAHQAQNMPGSQASLPPSPDTSGQYVQSPSDYQAYMDSTSSNTAPPPPPPFTATGKQLCPTCQFEVQPNTAFCHNCGTPIQEASAEHSPTMRGGTLESFYPDEHTSLMASTETANPHTPTPETGNDAIHATDNDKGV